MTPEEKAKELVYSFISYVHEDGSCYGNHENIIENAKQCALICVDEILEATKVRVPTVAMAYWKYNSYWEQVKNEIEKL